MVGARTIRPSRKGKACAGQASLGSLKPRPYDLSELADIAARLRMGFDPDPALMGVSGPPFYGRVLGREVQPGLFATGCDVDCVSNVVLSGTVEPSLMYGVQLYGMREPLLIEGYGAVSFEPGHAVLVGVGSPSGCESHAKSGNRYSYVGWTIKAEFFDRPLGAPNDDPLRRLERLVESGVSVASYPYSPTLIQAAERTLNNPYEGVLGDLFVESCTLAQVAEIARLADDGARTRPSSSLSRRQRDRVHRAREILDRRIVDPPSMQDLSRQVGINATSLRAEFQQAYGTSVFGYVREQRLQLARALLKTEDMPVSAIGYRVGFGNPGAFATAYRRRFGHTPSHEQSASQSRL